MKTFKEVFEEYGGDYTATMARFMNNETMYMKFLNMLFKDDNLDKLSEAIKNNDLNSAFEAAHTLKGVVANMGLTPMYDAVNTIVEPLRVRKENPEYPVMLEKIQNEYVRVIDLHKKLEGVN